MTSSRRRTWWLALLTATISAGLGAAINIATGSLLNIWAWVAVVLLTLAAAVASLASETGVKDSSSDHPTLSEYASRNVLQAGRDIHISGFTSKPVVIVAVVVWIAIVTGLIIGAKPTGAGASAHPRLRVVSVAVQKPSQVEADLSFGGPETSKGATETTAVDITVKNSGSAPAVILAAEVIFHFAEKMENCPASGGEVSVAANYSVKVPFDVPPRPFTIVRDMRFEVKAGVTDRFLLTIGPVEHSASSWAPWLYVAEIRLRQDESPQQVSLGTVALVAPPGDGLKNLENSPAEDLPCLKRNADIVQRLNSISAIRADELTTLQQKFAEISRR